MNCDICDYSTAGITSLTHHKKIHYTPEKPFDCTKCSKGPKNKFHLHQHYQTPSKNKVKAFQYFFCEKYFREKLNLRQHNDNIHQYIKMFSCQLCGQIFRKKGMECKELWDMQGTISPFKSLKRTHKLGS